MIQPDRRSTVQWKQVDIDLSSPSPLWSGFSRYPDFVEANMIVNGQFRRRGYLAVRLLSALRS